jgi:large subunit ribosomal protein L4
MRKVAMKSALTSKVQENQMIILDSLNFEAPKTKNIVEMLKALEANKALIITAESNEVVYKSARNIQGISIIPANNINVYDLLKYEKLIITKDAVSKIEEVYA